jgi:superfamily II DNA or RNA helicase
VLAEVASRAVAKGATVLIVAHMRQIVKQTAARFASYGLDVSCIMAGEPVRKSSVYCASIQTLARRGFPPASVVLIDEAHHAVAVGYADLIAHYRAAGAFISGASATPARLDGRGLGTVFGHLVSTVTVRELISQGFLVEPRVFAPPIDLSGIRHRAGEFDTPELAEKMTTLVGSLTKTWQQHTPGQATVGFAVNIAHSLACVDAFRAIGVRAEHVDHKMPHRQRDRVLRQLREAKIDMIWQVGLLGEGWDFPALQTAIDASPTESLARFLQRGGRIMRPPGPVTYLDHSGNHHRFGMFADEREWTLDAATKRTAIGPAVRTCPVCFACIAPGSLVCPECGAEIPTRSEAEQPGVENPGELTEFSPTKVYEKATVDEKAEVYRRLVQSASERGRKLGQARHSYHERFGVWPKFYAIERELYVCSKHEWEPKEYGWKRVLRCSRCFAQTSAVQAGA